MTATRPLRTYEQGQWSHDKGSTRESLISAVPIDLHVHVHSLGHERPSGLDIKQSPNAQDVFSANTRSRQLHWGDRVCGYYTSCL